MDPAVESKFGHGWVKQGEATMTRMLAVFQPTVFMLPTRDGVYKTRYLLAFHDQWGRFTKSRVTRIHFFSEATSPRGPGFLNARPHLPRGVYVPGEIEPNQTVHQAQNAAQTCSLSKLRRSYQMESTPDGLSQAQENLTRSRLLIHDLLEEHE